MKLFNKKDKNESLTIDNKEYGIIESSNYMLCDVRKEELNNCYSLSISKLSEINQIAIPTSNTIKNVINKKSSGTKMYKIINLGKNDSLKSMKDGNTFWGAIKKSDGTSSIAKLKEVNTSSITAIDPTIIMMSVALSGIESELNEIKELNIKIIKFLEEEKESEVESDLEILNRSISDFKFNLNDEKYLSNCHKQVMDIKRTANKNMLFYKKQIKDELLKNKFVTTSISMNSIINEIEKKFKYYRLSLYIYSYSTLMEILLLGNYQESYLISKEEELNNLDNDYLLTFNSALEYVKNISNKTLESNVLSGLGSAAKVIGNLTEKVKIKNANTWFNEKENDLKKNGQEIKDNFINRFNDIKESNSKIFIKQIEKVDTIYNKTKEIYFDDKNIYLSY